MNNQEDIKRIDAFLSGSMVETERKKFKLALSSDSGLMENFRIAKNLHESAISKEEYDFIKNIKKLQYRQANKNNSWIITMGLLAMLGISLFLVQQLLTNSEPHSQIKPIVEVESADNPTKQGVAELSSEYLDSENTQTLIEQDPQMEIKPLQEKPKPTTNASKSVSNKTSVEESDLPTTNSEKFVKNKDLELLMSSMHNTRSLASDLKLSKQPVSEANFTNHEFRFILEGKYDNTTLLTDDKLVVYIFDNKETSYNSFRPLMKLYPEVELYEKEYLVHLHKLLSIESGLYYYLIELESQEELLYVGKFTLS